MLGRITHRYHRGSVLPKIDAQLTPDGGAQILAARASTKDIVIATLAGIGGAVSVWAAVWGELDVASAIESGISAFLGLSLFAVFMKSYLERRRLHHAALLIRPWPLRLGETATARLHVVVDGGTETTVRSQGKYADTTTTSLYSALLPAQTEWTFTLPIYSPPSLSVESNEVSWELNTIVRHNDVEIPVSFELLVIPERLE
jgi:hypothetical protein